MEFVLSIVPYFIVFGLAYAAFVWLHRRNIDDARAAFWATVNQPKFYLSSDIDDKDVVVRAEHAREMLVKHGNPYLRPQDVFCYVWNSDAENASIDFEQWYDLRLLDVMNARKAFREAKARQMSNSQNEYGAAQSFGGQKVPNQN